MPSKLPEMYWSHTFDDVRTKVRLKIGYEQTTALQHYNTLASVVSAALGGGKKSGSGRNTVDFSRPIDQQFDSVYAPKSEADLQMALNKVLNRG